MEQRFAGHFPFVSATAHFFYSRDSSIAKLIHDMKYRGFSKIGNLLGEISAKELFVSGFFADIEAIVPVPMHYLKKARRGYNQTDNIAQGISKVTGIPVYDILKMNRSRKTQTSLTLEQRLKNAENLFSIRDHLAKMMPESILLVDDICTTGTTLGAAATAIVRDYPNVKIYLFTIGATF